MKILQVSATGDGAWFCNFLNKSGHDCQWVLGADKYREALAGLIPEPREHIDHPSNYDLIVFDTANNGDVADDLRQHTPVIGASKFAERLEKDRVFGIEFMERCGIKTPNWQAFDDVADALRWLKKTHKRTVFKPLGGRGEDCSTTYVSKSSEDMARYLEILFKRVRVDEFVLQEFVPGTEVSTNAWFNGSDFYAIDHTLEEKKFMAGGIGPNTGCAGNVVWLLKRPDPVFQRGLGRAKEQLAEAGFVGPIDLNTIVTEGEIFGLEWTPRFGYEGTCNLTSLLPMDFGEFMLAIATGGQPTLAAPRAGFCASVRLSVPPYPAKSDPKKFAGVPVSGIDPDHLEHWYLSDVRLREGSESELETIGTDGLIGAPMGCGETIHEAFARVQAMIDGLLIPDLQYRNDIEKRCVERFETMTIQGWLRPLGEGEYNVVNA